MWKSNEYCSFTSTWECDHDASYLASYSFTPNDSTEEVSAYEDDVPSSSTLIMSQPSLDHQAMELCCLCKPHNAVSIVGAIITSEARTIECYSALDGYLQSVRGKLVTSQSRSNMEEGDGDLTEKKLYLSVVKFKENLNELTIKFLGLDGKSSFTLTRLELVLTPSDVSTTHSTPFAASGSIDLTKVKSYLSSMGDNIPQGGRDLMQSVEQYQQSQMAGLGGMQAMFSSLCSGQSDTQPPSGLSAMLSMMLGARNLQQSHDPHTANQHTVHESCGQGTANQTRDQQSHDQNTVAQTSDQRTHETGPANQNTDSRSHDSSEKAGNQSGRLGPLDRLLAASRSADNRSHDNSERAGTQSTRLGPLERLLAAMPDPDASGEAKSCVGEENKDSMFKMLQGICGKVSEMRIEKTKIAVEDTDTVKLDRMDNNAKSEEKDQVSELDVLPSLNLNALKSALEQSAAELIQQSEERLKSYVDARLVAMETRLNNKLDSMMQALQKNGHPVQAESHGQQASE